MTTVTKTMVKGTANKAIAKPTAKPTAKQSPASTAYYAPLLLEALSGKYGERVQAYFKKAATTHKTTVFPRKSECIVAAVSAWEKLGADKRKERVAACFAKMGDKGSVTGESMGLYDLMRMGK